MAHSKITHPWWVVTDEPLMFIPSNKQSGFEFKTGSIAVSLSEIAADLTRENPVAYVVVQDENDYTKLNRWMLMHPWMVKKADILQLDYPGIELDLSNDAVALQIDKNHSKEAALAFVKKVRSAPWPKQYAGDYKVRVDLLSEDDLESS